MTARNARYGNTYYNYLISFKASVPSYMKLGLTISHRHFRRHGLAEGNPVVDA